MLKKSLVTVLIISVLTLAVLLSACADNEGFNKFDITFYNGDEIYKTVTVDSENFDLSANMPDAPVKADDEGGSYTFSHWAKPDGSVFSTEDKVDGALSLYAVYDYTPFTYTVEFLDWDGSRLLVEGKPTQSVIKGEAAVAPENPHREGYTFKGWDVPFDNITKRTTVHAVYEINTYNLVFSSLGNILSEYEVNYGEDITFYTPAPQSVKGLVFKGWTAEGTQMPSAMPARDLTVEAEWEVADVNLSITASAAECVYGDGSSSVYNISYTENEGFTYVTTWYVNGVKSEAVGKTFTLSGMDAGEYDVYAEVKAVYGDLQGRAVATQTKKYIVRKAPLKVIARDYEVVCGGDLPEDLPYSVQGFVNGDNEDCLSGDLVFGTEYIPGSGVGEYGITFSGYSSQNYDIAYVPAKLKVTKRPLTVSVVTEDGLTLYYGDEAPRYNVETQGLYGKDTAEDLGTVKTECNYKKGFATGEYTVKIIAGYNMPKADNYDITYNGASFRVNKKPVTVSVSVTDKEIFFTQEISYDISHSALADGDILSDVGDIYVQTDYTAGSKAGSYELSLRCENASLNYDVTLEGEVTFTVLPLQITFSGKVVFKDADNTGWSSSDINSFISGLPQGYTAQGTLSAKADAGIYELTGKDITEPFAWSVPFNVKNASGEDFTDSFVLNYDFTLKLVDYVSISVSDYRGVYNTSAQGGKVAVDGSSTVQVQYRVSDEWQTDAPMFVNAGKYVVYYKVSDEGEVLEEGSYKVVIDKAENEIVTDDVVTEYKYNGEKQTVTGATAKYENAAISYVNNEFTDVPAGGILQVIVSSEETENYNSAEKILEVTVLKADYASAPQIGELRGLVAHDKHLGSFALPEGFDWEDKDLIPVSGENRLYAYYCADTVNYNPLRVLLTLTGEKTKVDIKVADQSIRAGEGYTSGATVTREGITLDCVQVIQEFVPDTSVGKTYAIGFTLEENSYYTADVKYAILKVTSVLWNNAYYTAEDALFYATSGDIIITANTYFASGSVRTQRPDVYADAAYRTIKKGCKLVVPFDSSFSTDTGLTEAGQGGVGVTPGAAYVTLTVTAGTQLQVAPGGQIYVAAKRRATTGAPTGNAYANLYGALKIESGAFITVTGETSVFESLGYTYGEGTLIVESGKVYEPMILTGYKGGSITNAVKDDVFPLNQYDMTNIICRTEIHATVTYYAKVAMWISTFDNVVKSDVAFMGKGDDVFLQVRSGKIVKSYNESNGNVHYEFYGEIQINNFSLKLGGSLGAVKVSSAGKQVGVPGNFAFTIKEGCTINTSAGIKLLPGADFYIEKGAIVNINGGNLFVYGSDVTYDKSEGDGLPVNVTEGYQDGGDRMAYPRAERGDYFFIAPSGYDYDAATPATFKVAGTLNINGGEAGGTITAEEGGVINIQAGSNVNHSIKEDLSGSADKTFGIQNDRYYHSSASLKGALGEALAAGKSYKGGAEGWSAI